MHRRSFLKTGVGLLGAAAARGQVADPAVAQAPDELVFCDFNSGAETWSCEGEAFAQTWLNPDRYPRDPNAPFRGQIVGVEGDGYLSSTNPTARLKALGRVTSPEFTVERPYIHLKVGGYNQPGLSGVQLLIDGQPVRTASGFGTATQGYHKLRPVVWDVRELQGKPARIEVYDRASTSFVMVDSIVFSTSDQMRYRELPDVVAIDAGIQDWLERKVDAALAVGTNPAVASCIVAGGKIVARVAKGERKAGSGVAVELDDAFQLGSGSKPVTGTIAAVAIEDGVLPRGWQTTMADVCPELVPEGNPYRDKTVGDYMSHNTGLPRTPMGAAVNVIPNYVKWCCEPEVFAQFSWRERLYFFARDYLVEPPVTPGYGVGAMIPVSMINHLTDLDYDQMLQRYLANPLGMRNASGDFAVAASADSSVRQVWQHRIADGRAVPDAPVGYPPNTTPGLPVGGVNMSVTDVGKYMIAHMPGGAGPRLLTDATLEGLHTPIPGGRTTAGGHFYGGSGWGPEQVLTGRNIPYVGHNGSNGANYFHHIIIPGLGIGGTIMTNAAAFPDEAFMTPFFEEMLPELLKRA